MIIAFSGYARAGKDEAAKVLVEEFYFKRVAFADKLRDVLYALNPIVSMGVYENFHWNMAKNVYLQDVIDEYGWLGYKETEYNDEIRRLLQRLGTEAGRDTLGENIWVDSAFLDIPKNQDVVITDCRFPNEAQAVKDRGGYIARIERPGITAAGDHSSEHSLKDWPFDFKLTNDFNSVEEYHEYIRQFIDAAGEHDYFVNVIGEH